MPNKEQVKKSIQAENALSDDALKGVSGGCKNHDSKNCPFCGSKDIKKSGSKWTVDGGGCQIFYWYNDCHSCGKPWTHLYYATTMAVIPCPQVFDCNGHIPTKKMYEFEFNPPYDIIN